MTTRFRSGNEPKITSNLRDAILGEIQKQDNTRSDLKGLRDKPENQQITGRLCCVAERLASMFDASALIHISALWARSCQTMSEGKAKDVVHSSRMGNTSSSLGLRQASLRKPASRKHSVPITRAPIHRQKNGRFCTNSWRVGVYNLIRRTNNVQAPFGVCSQVLRVMETVLTFPRQVGRDHLIKVREMYQRCDRFGSSQRHEITQGRCKVRWSHRQRFLRKLLHDQHIFFYQRQL